VSSGEALMFVRREITATILFVVFLVLQAKVLALTSDRQSVASEAPVKRALLVGVNKYFKRPGDPWYLHSDIDVDRIKAVLTSPRFAFKSENITVIKTQEQTTHKGIVDAFEKLIDDTKKGDLVYFHFSGHGSQIDDTAIKHLNGKSNTLVPSDFDWLNEPTYNEITDVEIRELVAKLDQKKPLLATLTFDCCNSGGVTRGRHRNRGFEHHTDHGSANPEALAASTPMKFTNPTMSNIVVLTACQPNQKAFECDADGQEAGLFTYALCQSLMNAKPTDTYRDVLEKMRAEMIDHESAELQNPQYDGQIDKILMSGEVSPAQLSMGMHRTEHEGWTVEGGRINNITKGSRYLVFQSGTKNFKTTSPEGEVTISAVGLTESFANPSANEDKLAPLKVSRIIEAEHRYPAQDKLKIAFQELDATSLQLLKEGLKTPAGAFEIVDDLSQENASQWDIKIAKAKDGVTATRSTGTEICSTSELTPKDVSALRSHLVSELKWKFLKSLNNDNRSARISLKGRIIPVEVKARDLITKWVTAVSPADPVQDCVGDLNPRELVEGEYFAVELKNESKTALYVSVFDLDSKGNITKLYPNEQVPVRFELPGDSTWHRIPPPYAFDVRGPFGADEVKVIATTRVVDLGNLATAETSRARDNQNLSPLQRLLIWGGCGTRDAGQDIGGVASEDWVSTNIMFGTRASATKTDTNN